MIMGLLRFIGGVLMTLLPPRYREGRKLLAHAVTSGALQSFFALFLGVTRLYVREARGDVMGLSAEVAKEIWKNDPGALRGAGMVTGFANFWLDPVNMIVFYFVFEGIIRCMAAAGPGQVVGSLPLYVISGVHGLVDKVAYRRDLGPLVVDEVVRGGEKQKYDLKVYSCRPKPDWNAYVTIEFEGQFYQMYDEEPGTPPRRFIYYLRKNPTGRLVVNIHPYKIDDVLKPPPDKWAGTPRVRDVMKPQKRRPIAADEVIRGGSQRQGYDLKIYSCKPKPDWNYFITVEFEDQLYQLLREESGPEPRPYVFYLRKNPANRPAPVVSPYKPDDVLKS